MTHARRTSIFPLGAKLEGEIEGDGDLIVWGEIQGPVRIAGSLVIEVGAHIRGGVSAETVIVRGTLEGAALGVQLVRLEAGCRMIGDAKAERVVLLDGALLRGRVTMGIRRVVPTPATGPQTAAVPKPATVPQTAAMQTSSAVQTSSAPIASPAMPDSARARSTAEHDDTLIGLALPQNFAAPGESSTIDRWTPNDLVSPATRKLARVGGDDVQITPTQITVAPAPIAPRRVRPSHEARVDPQPELATVMVADVSVSEATVAKVAVAQAVVAQAPDKPRAGPPSPFIPSAHGKQARRKE